MADRSNLRAILGRVSALLGEADTLIDASAYEYALSRPLDREGAPAGYINHRKARKRLTWKYRHGVVQYARPLSDSQVTQYRLAPLSAEDPAIVEMITDLVYDDVMSQLVAKDEFIASVAGGNSVVVRYDFDSGPGVKWGVTLFNRIGNQVGEKIVHTKVEQVARTVWEMYDGKQKDAYYKVLLTDI